MSQGRIIRVEGIDAPKVELIMLKSLSDLITLPQKCEWMMTNMADKDRRLFARKRIYLT